MAPVHFILLQPPFAKIAAFESYNAWWVWRSETNLHTESLQILISCWYALLFSCVRVRGLERTRQNQPWLIIRFLAEEVRFWFWFWLICWYLIESMIPVSEQDVQDLRQKNRPTTLKIFDCTHGVLFIPIHTKPMWWVCCQKALFLV